MWLGRESRELLQGIYDEIQRATRASVAPFTRGGKLDLSSPNIVGHLPVSRGGTGGTTGGGGGGMLESLYWDGEPLTFGGDGLSWGA